MDVKPGLYKHYKGNYYLVHFVATHTETNELMVVYQVQYGEYKMLVRPLKMFQDILSIDGQAVPRFEQTWSNLLEE